MISFRFQIAAAVLVAGVCVAKADTLPVDVVLDLVTTGERPKVEFVEDTGRRCLRPVVTSADVSMSDFRAAEIQWLAEKYPGSKAQRWETVLILDPSGELEGDSKTTVKRETAHVLLGNGEVIEVCFDIALVKHDRFRDAGEPSG